MKTSERILQFIDDQNITKTEVYNKTGISNGALDKKSNLRSDNLEKILLFYNINPEWLLTGRGEMLKSCEKNYLIDLRDIFKLDDISQNKATLTKLKKKITQYITNNYNVDGNNNIVDAIISDGATVYQKSNTNNSTDTSLQKEVKLKNELIEQLQAQLKDKDTIIELLAKKT